jgi:hypothetical protein
MAVTGFTKLLCYCPICKKEMDYWSGAYGRTQRCCSKDCYEEFEWRNTLAIRGREYYPRKSPPKQEGP